MSTVLQALVLLGLAAALGVVEIWRLQRRQTGAVTGAAAKRADRVLWPAVAGLLLTVLTLGFPMSLPFMVGAALVVVSGVAFLVVEARLPLEPDRRPISYRPRFAVRLGPRQDRAPRWVFAVLAVGVASELASLVIQLTVTDAKLPASICLWAGLGCIAFCLVYLRRRLHPGVTVPTGTDEVRSVPGDTRRATFRAGVGVILVAATASGLGVVTGSWIGPLMVGVLLLGSRFCPARGGMGASPGSSTGQ